MVGRNKTGKNPRYVPEERLVNVISINNYLSEISVETKFLKNRTIENDHQTSNKYYNR